MKNLFFFQLIVLSLLSSCDTKQPIQQTTATSTEAYQETYRNQFHFSPDSMWMNDPNGMVYYDGEYHLFYQYYPDSTVWGPMHWGHAISTDLIHWEHLPIALFPDSLGYIFSGSAVIDWQNTSGFGDGTTPPMIAIFTHHLAAGERAGRNDFQNQSIAYSLDSGRSWTKYAGNPVIPNPGIRDFRDPKVIWDENSQQWVMVFAAGDHVKLYGSPNLKDWAHLSDFGHNFGSHDGVWECPDLFPLPVEGSNTQQWVLLSSINPGHVNGGSGTQYFVGDFNGTEFVLDPAFAAETVDNQAIWLDYGRDNYAGVTWSDIPAADGRRLFIGWMSNWNYALVVPTSRWRSAMTIPRVLKLVQDEQGYRLRNQPVKALNTIRGQQHTIAAQVFSSKQDLTPEATPCELILTYDLSNSNSASFGVELSNGQGEIYRLGYDAKNKRLFSDRTQLNNNGFSEKFAPEVHYAPYTIAGDQLKLHLLLDKSAAELFVDDGTVAITDIYFPAMDFDQLTLFSEGGATSLTDGVLYPLNSIWQRSTD